MSVYQENGHVQVFAENSDTAPWFYAEETVFFPLQKAHILFGIGVYSYGNRLAIFIRISHKYIDMDI